MNQPPMNAKETLLRITELMGESTVEALTERELGYELAFHSDEGFHELEQNVKDVVDEYGKKNINLNGVINGLLTIMIDKFEQTDSMSY